MGYVAVTGGDKAIENATKLNKLFRLSHAEEAIDPQVIQEQMRLLIDRVMGEGGLYAPEYAAIALKQAEGDPAEASFLLRSYRSTLQRNYTSRTLETKNMRVIRRISSAFKDIPGGQMLGPTYDYTHRLLDFSLRHENSDIKELLEGLSMDNGDESDAELLFQKVTILLREQGLLAQTVEEKEEAPFDITRDKAKFPMTRSARLQMLARGETGAMITLAYSSMRGYGAVHPTIAELRVGYCPVYIPHPFQEDESLYVGEIMLTEVETINSFSENEQGNIEFMLGYGLVFGQNEAKAIAMAILERSLETKGNSPAQDEEFVLLHIDSIEAHGFVSHLKLPHYVTFQSKLDRIRQAREEKSKDKVRNRFGNQEDSFSHT
ncbi:carbon-phosphorus lyase complex subunit PhnI [Bacillaceae bacterium Marseille-Q3522]|nr:carbon-phosphorus lyase complex subunit PhnI [Bacillaceae bacterium Marseille-Q3522]